MRENTDVVRPPQPDEEDRTALRSTGDSRTVVGTPQPPQRAQPSLGDPENAPGNPEPRPPSSEDS